MSIANEVASEIAVSLLLENTANCDTQDLVRLVQKIHDVLSALEAEARQRRRRAHLDHNFN